MLDKLSVFKREHGHCNVPTGGAPAHVALGRWVAAQRYRHRVGELEDEKVRALTALGFVWSPADVKWESMFRDLKRFAARFGHTNVPERCDEWQKLANWVHSQRHRRKCGKLSSERIRRLDELEFCWKIYKNGQSSGESPARRRPEAVAGDSVGESDADTLIGAAGAERLYVIREGVCVQFNGKGRLPPELKAFSRINGGEMPPYIPLPARPVVFLKALPLLKVKRILWKGSGPLPGDVLDFVRENGALPRYE